MPRDTSVGILTGLVFVTLFLVMIASLSAVGEHIRRPFHGPAQTYDLAGSSRPAK
jgi:hypothetical protein